ncbi:hypothetical protein [Streptomyces sp. MMBL 11-3]|uniref:hypothetical protein n=1 Tax=Streptomyces sp. MMBL 11-3 TaxID=3382639 RepID=UPI0039B596ED
MPAKFRADEATVRWHGSDDTTPPDHSIAVGTDRLGTEYVWLFRGKEPTDEAFVGSISVSNAPGRAAIAYDSAGGFVGLAPIIAPALAKLAARAASEEGHRS